MSRVTGRFAFALSCALLALGLAVIAQAYSPPPVTQLTLKKPDLTISAVKATVVLPCPAGGHPSLRFFVTVENVGKLTANPGPANQLLVVHGPTHTVKHDLTTIAAGGNLKVGVRYDPQAGEPSGYPNVKFTFVVNPSHTMIESNYDNNTFTENVSLPTDICNEVRAIPSGM